MTTRKTKIIVTLGPASSTGEAIQELAEAGADIFRLNFSHGSHEMHIANAVAVRETSRKLGKSLAILMDLQGPKLRIGTIAGGNVQLKTGTNYDLDLQEKPGDEHRAPLLHPEIFDVVKPGNELLLDDGKIRLRVESANSSIISTTVINGGELSCHKGVNLPDTVLHISAITEKDKADAAIAREIAPEWIAISFVQSADDVALARRIVADQAKDAKLMAKIEKPSAIAQIDAILNNADAIMIARGDLGVETPFESVPHAQVRLIQRAKAANKPVVVATQMLESMVQNGAPTRAEVTDIAFAVACGADAIMLSAETASGAHPSECVRVMAKIAEYAERQPGFKVVCQEC